MFMQKSTKPVHGEPRAISIGQRLAPLSARRERERARRSAGEGRASVVSEMCARKEQVRRARTQPEVAIDGRRLSGKVAQVPIDGDGVDEG